MNFSLLTAPTPSLTGLLEMVTALFTNMLSMIGDIASAAMVNPFLALPIITALAFGGFALFKKMT